MKRSTVGFEIGFTTFKMWLKMVLITFIFTGFIFFMITDYFTVKKHNIPMSHIVNIYAYDIFPMQKYLPLCVEWNGVKCLAFDECYVKDGGYQALIEYRAYITYLLFGIVKYTGLIFLIVPILAFLFYRKVSKKYQEDKVIRGQQFIDTKRARKECEKVGKCRIPLVADVKMPEQFETHQCLITGQIGAGKTVLMSQMMSALRNQKAIVFDYKGDYLLRFYNPKTDIIFNPADKRCVQWSIFNEFSSAGHITNFVRSLIPDSKGMKSEKFWLSSAQKVLDAVLQSLWVEGRKTNKDLWDTLLLDETKLREFFKKNDLEANALALQALGVQEGSGQSSGIIGALAQFIAIFGYTALTDGGFSFKQWARDDKQKGWIFIECTPEVEESLRPGLSLVLDLIMSEILSLPEDRNRRVFFAIDELKALQVLPSLIKLITLGRSFGGCLIAATQDLDGIKEIYGDNDLGTIFSNPWTCITLRNQSVYTAKYISDSIGEREIEEAKTSYTMGPANARDSMSVSQNKRYEKTVLPAQINGLDVLEAIVRLPIKNFLTRGYLVKQFFNPIHPPEDRFHPISAFQLAEIEKRLREMKEGSHIIKPEEPNKEESNAENPSDECFEAGKPDPVDKDLF